MPSEIGVRLQQAREQKNLTVEQVARATHLRPHHIQAMEEGRLEALPSPVQARAFLRIYAEYLGLSFAELMALRESEETQASSVAVTKAPVGRSAQETMPQEASAPVPPAPPPQTGETAVEPSPARQERPVSPPVSTEETKPEEASPVQEAGAIFRAIGETLRRQRESISLTLEDVAGQIHLRPQVLQALEEGNLAALPSLVQARGMLSTYADFLGLDTEALLLRFAEGLQQQHRERMAAMSTPRARRSVARRLPVFVTGDLLAGAFLLLVLLGVIVWGSGQIGRLSQNGVPTVTLPSVSEVLLHTSVAAENEAAIPTSATEPSPSASEAANPTALATVAVEGKVQVVILALQRVWVRVIVDGRVVQEGRLLPGQAYPFGGQERIEVLSGNGAAIKILYNQQELGLLGSVGEVVDLVFTTVGVQTPTPTVTPTLTASPTPTITPRPSPTPRPSATARP